MRKSVHTTTLIVIVALLVVSLNGVQSVSGYFGEDFPAKGPYVDEIIFKVISSQDQRVLALQAGEIELDTMYFDPSYLPTLATDPDISIHQVERNGYGQLTINCAKYPLNISGFRRAFAFAFNKTKVASEVMDGFVFEHDSVVPQPNNWCAEDEFDWNYYTAEPDIGNLILDNLGFEINATSGYRLAPNGTSFEIVFEHSIICANLGALPNIVLDALESLHIDSRNQYVQFTDYMDRVNHHEDYDIVFYGVDFDTSNVDWLAHEYWSDNANVDYLNPSNFRNETYDLWRNQLLDSPSYEEVYEAAAEMQKILHYNVPRLVVYENTYLQGYRTDQFTGHVDVLDSYSSGPTGYTRYTSSLWNMRKIHNLNGSMGGTVPIAISEDPDSFNFYTANSAASTVILEELWPSLFKYGPDMNPIPDLVENMLTETHSDNSMIPTGHIRFSFDIIENATWSDGTPLTAEDVAFTFTYQFESGYDGNPAVNDLMELVSAYAPSTYNVVIEYATESYWQFSSFAYDYIIPRHIFNDVNGIGYEGWDTWNPVFDSAEPNVNCGPFNLTDYVEEEYYKLERNPLFHYEGELDDLSTTTTNQTIVSDMWLTVISIALVSGSGILIVYCIYSEVQDRKNTGNT